MKKILMITALAGFVAVGHAQFKAINLAGTDPYDNGDYELWTGDSSIASYDQRVDWFEGMTITTSNAFDLGAISITYEADGVPMSNVVVRVSQVDGPTNSSYIVPPPATSTLFSATFDVPVSSGGDDTLYLALGTNIPLAADSYYMISFDISGSNDNDFWWRRSTSEAYPGGDRVGDDGSRNADRDYVLGLGVAPPPTANDDEYTLPFGASSTNVAAPGVLDNDLSYDSAVLITNISSGSLTLNPDGSFSCSGLVDGTNTFSYAVVSGSVTSAPATVTLLASITPTPPDAVDDTFNMDLNFGAHIEGNVLNNDTNNSVLFEMYAVLVDYPVSNGTLNVSSNGDFFYTPDPGFTGADIFTYKAYTEVATSVVASVTLIVESNESPGVVIDSFEYYDNSTTENLRDLPDGSLYWNTFNSGVVDIYDRNTDGPSYQELYINYTDYRGAASEAALWSGIPDSSTEYWLYWEMRAGGLNTDGNFGVTTNDFPSVGSGNIGEFAAGVRMLADGGTNLNLYAWSAGTNDVLLTTGIEEDTWYGIWMNINNNANTYDVYLSDALGEPGRADTPVNLGSQVGSDIPFYGANAADLVKLLVSAQRSLRIDNIINVDPANFIDNQPANLYGSSLSASGTMQLSIGLNDRANPADYWPVSSDDLVVSNWVHVAHSDAPDGTFAVTNLNLAGGDTTNKVIYVKATNNVEFFRINNQ